MKEECYERLFRRKIYTSLEALQTDVDEWIRWYNRERCHSGKHCCGKTPWQTWMDSIELAKEKNLNQLMETSDNPT